MRKTQVTILPSISADSV